MPKYEFTLTYKLADKNAEPGQYTEALYEAGCSDALVGVGEKGRIALDFTREAKSLQDAFESAMNDVHRAIPDAELYTISTRIVQ